MKTKKKGFTLIELIVVIAIMGILMAILIPAWMNYIKSARIKTQNANAKIIFNAAQTAATETMFRERTTGETFMDSGDFYFYWDGSSGYTLGNKTEGGSDQVTSPPASIFSDPDGLEFDKRIANKINSVYSGDGETVYKIWIKNYKVMAVVSARTENDTYLGAYPTVLEEEQDVMHIGDFPTANVAHLAPAPGP